MITWCSGSWCFLCLESMRKKWEKTNERKWKETERIMEGNWKDNGLGSGFWCPLTSFDTSFGRRSDVVRNLEQHAYGIAYFTSFSRFWGGESSLCCDHFHLTSTCGESSAFQYDLFVFRKVKCHFDDGLVVASTMCFLHLSHNKTCQNRVCRTSAFHWDCPGFLVNLFDFLIQRRPSETWHNSIQLVDFNLSVYMDPMGIYIYMVEYSWI